MENLITILRNFGLSHKEARIYLTLLEFETAKVAEIAKHTGINRSSTYVVLEILRKRGLVGITDDKKVRRYIAASLETLLQTIRVTAHKYQSIKEDIESALPEFKALAKGTKRRPIVGVFEGKEGLINAFEDSLKNKEKLIRVASSVENMVRFLPEYFPGYVQRRIKGRIKMRGIHPDDKMAQQLIRTTPVKLDTPILIPKSKYKIPADLAIYDDKIGYMTPAGSGFAILIQNKELAEVMKSIFDLAWEGAKRLSKIPKRGIKIQHKR